MTVTKIHDLLLLKRIDFGPKIIWGILQIGWFLGSPKIERNENDQKCSIWTPQNYSWISQILWFLAK